MSDSLQPHESQHARPPCLLPTPGVYPNSCPLSRWCHLILCCPLLFLPPIPPSIRVFFNESTLLMRWWKYWSFSFSISPSNEHPGLISFRMDWLDLPAVQGTLKSLLQYHSGSVLAMFKSWLCHLTVVWSWEGHLISVFTSLKWRQKQYLLERIFVMIKYDNTNKKLKIGSVTDFSIPHLCLYFCLNIFTLDNILFFF